MSRDEEKHVDALQKISIDELLKRYEEVYGEPCRTRDRSYLIYKVGMSSRISGGKLYDIRSNPKQSIWELPDGRWTLLSHLMRALCQSPDLAPDELYYILRKCKAENRFRRYWESGLFYQKAGMGKQGFDYLLKDPDASAAKAGDFAWALGNIGEAIACYEKSIRLREEEGAGGLFRIHFFHERFADCAATFREFCPPHAYYVEYKRLIENNSENDDAVDFDRLNARFRGKSPCFISEALYMCRVVIFAILQSDGFDDELRTMVLDYFDITDSQLQQHIVALDGRDDLLPSLKKKISPKPIESGRNKDQLFADGQTIRAQKIAQSVIKCGTLVSKCIQSLDLFLQGGSASDLDQMLQYGSPFGLKNVDALIIEEALSQRKRQVSLHPSCRIALIRRLNTICEYPPYDFLGDYIEVMNQCDELVEPADVISAILNLQWYKTPYTIDDTGIMGTRKGFGKTEIANNRDWLEIVLNEYPAIFDRNHFKTRDGAITALYHAYQFLKDRYNEVREKERWVSEAQLGDALNTLFGKSEVQRHVRPIWLAPQHLDYFLPNYNLAIEYMGVQHYEAIELFGGNKGLQETKRRDENKRVLCERMGVSLVYVTYEEDIGRRAQEIYNHYHPEHDRS